MHTSLTIDTAWGIVKNFFKNATNAQKRKAEGALEATDQQPTKTPRNETNADTDTHRAAVEFLQPSLSITNGDNVSRVVVSSVQIPNVSQCLPPSSDQARTNNVNKVPNVSPFLQSTSCLPPPSQQVHAKPATPSSLKLISRADLDVSGTPKIAPPVPHSGPGAVHVLNCVTIPSTSRWLQRDEETIEYSPYDFLNENNIDSIDDINVLD